MHRFLAVLAAVAVLAGCSGKPAQSPSHTAKGPSAKNGESDVSGRGEAVLRIEPEDVRIGTPVRLIATGYPLENATVEWLVNGNPAAGAPDPAALHKGDTLQAKATGPAGTVVSRVVTVSNSPPELKSARFSVENGKSAEFLGVVAEAVDPDGDPVRFDIAWKKNGEPAGSGPRMELPVRRGDKVTVTIVALDGEGPGRPVTLTREIRNTPPMIRGHEQFRVEGNVVSFRVVATDADGDPLSYAIKEGPPGASIDPSSGRVLWNTSGEPKGKFPFLVAVSDGAGGETTARINVTIREETSPEAR